MIEDRETREVILESLGRILELEKRVDVLSRLVERKRPRRILDQPLRSQEFIAFIAAQNRSRARAGREPFEFTSAGMEAALGNYHETYHPKNHPCPPAPPPSAPAAEETSSGEQRCTAAGVASCCRELKYLHGGLQRKLGVAFTWEGIYDRCIFCGTPINKET